MAEQLDLTSSITPATRTAYTLKTFLVDLPAQAIEVVVIGTDGVEVKCVYSGALAMTRLNTLNNSNNTTTSMIKRIFNALVADGKLPAGSVSGTPS